ncbi:2Fe-2S iron-sulfur cluster-binding protein [Roseibium salinum]|nr:2Fe-2S iron-sulfur cluster-binding protein [Roseibium salinum]
MSVPPLSLTVNGARVTVTPRAGLTLLAHLRNDLGLTGTKTGCATGACGACTVVMNGAAVQACQVPAAALQKRRCADDRGAGEKPPPGARWLKP